MAARKPSFHQACERCGQSAPGEKRTDKSVAKKPYVFFRCACGWAWSLTWEQLQLALKREEVSNG